MRKKGIAFFILSILLILISGCQTIKGAFEGAMEGAKEDWNAAKKIDAWMKENLW